MKLFLRFVFPGIFFFCLVGFAADPPSLSVSLPAGSVFSILETPTDQAEWERYELQLSAGEMTFDRQDWVREEAVKLKISAVAFQIRVESLPQCAGGSVQFSDIVDKDVLRVGFLLLNHSALPNAESAQAVLTENQLLIIKDRIRYQMQTRENLEVLNSLAASADDKLEDALKAGVFKFFDISTGVKLVRDNLLSQESKLRFGSERFRRFNPHLKPSRTDLLGRSMFVHEKTPIEFDKLWKALRQ